MKKISILLSFLLVASCGNSKKQSATLLELKVQKATLIDQIDSLSTILKSVESKISKLDTTKRLNVVTAVKAKNKLFRHYIEVQGTVEAEQSVELYPERSGTITSIFVKEGQQVSKGQNLAQIDSSIIESSITELQTQLDLARTTFERQKRLWDQNIGSELQFLQAKAKKEGLENNLNSLREQAKKSNPKASLIFEITNLLANVRINDFQNSGIVIPTKLIQKDGLDKKFVYTLQKQGNTFVVEKTYINTTLNYDNESFIEEGLTENILIVDKGFRLVKANENVILAE